MDFKRFERVAALSFVVALIFTSLPAGPTYDAYVVVYTDKSQYPYFRQPVRVTGQIYYQTQAVEGGIVAVQVDYPNKTTAIIRTVPVGLNVTFDYQLGIVSVIPSDQNGNPKTIFTRDGKAYFKVTVRNNRITSRIALMTVSVCDIDYTPLDLVSMQASIAPESDLTFIAETMLPPWCSTGTGKVHVSVLTDWPSSTPFGYPYCPGMSANFTITSGGAPYACINSSEPVGGTTYNMTFRLQPFGPLGIYDIRVGAFYKGFSCFKNTTITLVTQELGDLDFDHDIDLFDAVSIMGSYGVRSGERFWDAAFDLSPNGKIELYDAVIVLGKYGKKY